MKVWATEVKGCQGRSKEGMKEDGNDMRNLW